MRFPRPNDKRAAVYRASGKWCDDTIPALIANAVACSPDKTAVIDASGAALSYRDLAAQTDRVAGYLASRGVTQGDIVTVCLPNWCQAVVAFVAAMKLGAAVNPVPVTYGRADLSFAIGKCASRALLIPGRFRSVDFTELVSQLDLAIMAGLAVVRVGKGRASVGVAWEEACAAAPITGLPSIAADDPVAVLFTSGTESRAKGAVHTHNTILFGERALAAALAIDSNDIAFMASPVSHTTGFMHGVVMTLTMGGTLSLLDIFDGAVAARQLAAHRCTWTMGATPFLAEIAAALASSNERLPHLRYFLCGGAPIPEVLVRRAAAVGLRVMSVYGSTESPPHTVVYPNDPPENAWATDGRPVGGIEVKIVGENRTELPAGEIGEEWSRGPNTFLGYLGEPELTAKDLDADGWYHSGDLARLLPDGSIRVTGRIKDIIIRGGQNISVREVEDHLAAHPSVRQAAVVGIPHPRLGETGCAVVVANPGRSVTLAELVDYLLAKGVARFKLPERLEVWPSLPTNPSGKIQKFLIRQMLADADSKTNA